MLVPMKRKKTRRAYHVVCTLATAARVGLSVYFAVLRASVLIQATHALAQLICHSNVSIRAAVT